MTEKANDETLEKKVAKIGKTNLMTIKTNNSTNKKKSRAISHDRAVGLTYLLTSLQGVYASHYGAALRDPAGVSKMTV